MHTQNTELQLEFMLYNFFKQTIGRITYIEIFSYPLDNLNGIIHE